MQPEYNSNLNEENAPKSEGAIKPASDIVSDPSVINPNLQEPVVTPPDVVPAPYTNSGPSTSGVGSAKPEKLKKRFKFNNKIFLIVFILILLIGGAAAIGYVVGKGDKVTPVVEEAPKPIDLPPEATVYAECVPGRGKQYIIPKDIPAGGPIYDVNNGKVIAIEYILGIKALLTNSDAFSSTLLLLTRNYPVDHFTVVPEPPKAGDTDQFMHLIMFVVSKEEAKSITCNQPQSTGDRQQDTAPSTNTSTTTQDDSAQQ